MSNNVVSLAEYKAKKGRKEQSGIVQAMRDSLDNEAVKRKYNVGTKGKTEPTLEQRQERIKESIKRINNLMDQLNSNNKESK